MAANYDIIVKAVDQTKATFNNIERSLSGIQSAANKAQAVLGALITGQAVKKLFDAGVAIDDIQRKLKFITPAGTDVKNLFTQLSGLASTLGADVYDISEAFVTLKNNGLAPTVDRLTAVANIAKASGASLNSIADALGNVGDAEKLKAIERATNDMIKIDEIMNAFGASTGRFAIKYAGETVKIVSSSAEAVKAIENLGQVQLAGAGKDSVKTLGGAFGELKTKVLEATNAILEGGLKDALIDVAEKATAAVAANKELFKSFGGDLATAVTSGAAALKLLADNFGLIKDVAITLLLTRIGLGFISLSNAISRGQGTIANIIRTLLGIAPVGRAAATAITATAVATTGLTTAMTVGPITAFATRMGVLFATIGGFSGILTAIGAAIVSFVTSPIVLLTAALVGIELAFQKAFDISPIDTMAAGLEKLVTNNFPRVAKFLNDVGAATGMAPPPSVVNAPKPIVGSGTGLRADGTQDPRVTGQVGSIASQAINAAAGKDTFDDKKFNNVLDALGELNKKIADSKNAIKVLEPELARALDAGDVVRYNQVWEALKSNYDTIGKQVLPNLAIASKQARKELDFDLLTKAQDLEIYKGQLADTALQAKIFAMELAQSAADLDKNTIRLNDTVNMTEKFAQEIRATNIELATNAMRLADSGSMSKKFAQEITATQQSIAETALRLGDAQYQQGLFNNNIEASRQVIAQNTITFGKLNEAYAQGTISSLEYATALRSIDESLLNVTQKTILLNEEYSKIVKNSGDSSAILANLTAQYQTGAISLEEYAKKLSMVSYEYENLSSVTAKAMKGANDEIRTQDLSTEAAKNLTAQLRAGTISWRQYNSAISKLDSTGVQKSFINIESEILRVKTLGEALSDTLNESTKKAGDALADNLTSGIMKGQLRLSSFKDFFGSILNDITAMLIKKQFVSPIVDALTGAMGSGGGMGGGLLSSLIGGGGGGSSGGGLGSIFSGIGDWFGGFFATGGYLPGGKLGIAGEAGPELISGPANITPMDQNTGATPIVNFTINAIDTQTGVEFLMKNKPQIIGMVQQGFNSQGQRGIYA